MSDERRRLQDRLDLIQRDIDELANQVADGEIDEATADRLRAGYTSELEVVAAQIGELPAKSPGREAAPRSKSREEAPVEQQATGRSRSRIIVGSAIVLAAIAFVGWRVTQDATPDEPSPAASPGELSIDPNNVTNEQLEQVVAANPNIPGMRLALADRYFVAQELGGALAHYLYLAEHEPDLAIKAFALARLGWISHAVGEPESGEQYIEESLASDPGNGEATLYRGFISLYGLGDPAKAIPQLEAALELPDLPQGTVTQIETALAEARQGADQ